MDHNKKINPEIKNILIINLGGIGDIFLSTPALKALKKYCPGSRICLLATAQVLEFAKGLPYIDEVFILNLDLIKIRPNLQTLLALRKAKIDLAINMRTLVSPAGALKMRFLLAFINPKIKAGRDTQGRGDFFDFKIYEADKPEKHEIDYNSEIMRALGIEVQDRKLDFKIEEGSFNKINRALEKEGVSKEDVLVCLHCGGKPSHRWPLEKLSQSAEFLNKNINCKFVLTGGKGEAVRLGAHKPIVSADLKVIDFTGKLTINELGALLSRADLFIVNDTGPMHLAAALKTPLVAIFGPGYLTQFDPRTISEKAVVIYKKAECSPCNKVVCKSMKCLNAITVEEVSKAALRLLIAKK